MRFVLPPGLFHTRSWELKFWFKKGWSQWYLCSACWSVHKVTNHFIVCVLLCMACRGAAAAADAGQHSEGGDHPSQTGAPAASQRSGLVRCVKLPHIKSKCSNDILVSFSSSGFVFVFVFISFNFYGFSLWLNIFNVSVMAKTKKQYINIKAIPYLVDGYI